MGRDYSLRRPPVGWIGLTLAPLLFLGVILVYVVAQRATREVPDSRDLCWMAYAVGLVAGWWWMRPRPDARDHCVSLMAVLLVQVAGYLSLLLAGLLGSTLQGWPFESRGFLEVLVFWNYGMFFLFGPLIGIVGMFATRGGLAMLLAQIGGPVALVLFG